MKNTHEFMARLVWNDSTGEGTADYSRYSRQYRLEIEGKPDLLGSAAAMFRGEADKHDPEDLFVAAIASCHMLTYLALCARNGILVRGYEDEARGTLKLTAAGGGRFAEVTLHPRVTIAGTEHAALALELHDRAHELCFIAQSCSVPIRHEPRIEEADAAPPAVEGVQ